jgi:hypothetical protein
VGSVGLQVLKEKRIIIEIVIIEKKKRIYFFILVPRRTFYIKFILKNSLNKNEMRKKQTTLPLLSERVRERANNRAKITHTCLDLNCILINTNQT